MPRFGRNWPVPLFPKCPVTRSRESLPLDLLPPRVRTSCRISGHLLVFPKTAGRKNILGSDKYTKKADGAWSTLCYPKFSLKTKIQTPKSGWPPASSIPNLVAGWQGKEKMKETKFNQTNHKSHFHCSSPVYACLVWLRKKMSKPLHTCRKTECSKPIMFATSNLSEGGTSANSMSVPKQVALETSYHKDKPW